MQIKPTFERYCISAEGFYFLYKLCIMRVYHLLRNGQQEHAYSGPILGCLSVLGIVYEIVQYLSVFGAQLTRATDRFYHLRVPGLAGYTECYREVDRAYLDHIDAIDFYYLRQVFHALRPLNKEH